MERTPDGTPVGVDDPYEHAGPCDHLTGDGRCRYALDYAGQDPGFTAERRADDYECLVADEDADWPDCPHYRSTTDGKECIRCGLEEVRMAHDAARPLVEEHHLSYGSGGARRSDGAAGDDGQREVSGYGEGRSEGRGDGSRAREGDSHPSGEPPTPGPTGEDPTDAGPSGADRPPGSGTGGDPEPGEADDGEAADSAPGGGDADDAPSHEITVGLCRWCHAKVHKGFARVDDDANPDPEAIAERESRRGVEMSEFGFSTARERRREE